MLRPVFRSQRQEHGDPSSARDKAYGMIATELRRCPGGSSIPTDLIGAVSSAKYRQLLMIAAKQPPPQETRFCWTVGWSGDGAGSRGVMGARRVGANLTPLTFTGNIEPGFAQIAGRVTKERRACACGSGTTGRRWT